MKKALIVFSLLVALGHSGYSQARFGIKEGLNLSTVHFDRGPSNDKNIKAGLYVGVMSEIAVSKKFFIRPELLYSEKGWYNNGSVKFNYVSFPVLAGYRPLEKVSVLMGPELGFQTKNDLTNQRPLDIGLIVGIAYQISNQLGMEVRYCHGARHLIKWDEYTSNTLQSYVTNSIKDGYNRVLQVGLFYFLKKSKESI